MLGVNAVLARGHVHAMHLAATRSLH